jgi:UDP-glucose 4-epimerase
MQPSFVAGAGGLLGKAVCAHLGAAAYPARVRWGTPDANADLQESARRLVEQWPGVRCWQVLWCAGAGVHGTSQEQFDVEIETFARFLRMLPREFPGQISLFLASSAGGIYSGVDPPFTERDQPNPISLYGRTKLATEELAVEFAVRNGQPTVIGRIANLYGPGQNLSKPQGLISQLCWAQLLARPTSIWVSPDTIRSYLYVSDCAEMIAGSLALARTSTRPATVKILTSPRGVTIAAILGECRRVFGRPVKVVLGTSPLAKFQSSNLSLRSVTWPELDTLARTTLPAGIAATYQDLLSAHQLPAAH